MTDERDAARGDEFGEAVRVVEGLHDLHGLVPEMEVLDRLLDIGGIVRTSYSNARTDLWAEIYARKGEVRDLVPLAAECRGDELKHTWEQLRADLYRSIRAVDALLYSAPDGQWPRSVDQDD